MDVVIVGGHGQIAMRLAKLLADRGDRVRGVIRNPDHAADLEAVGAEGVVCDIENEELTEAVEGADAVIFAAGAGPGSWQERKQTVDLGGAVKLIEACQANDIKRYLIVSSIGAQDPSVADGDFRAYLEAKHDADEAPRRERARLHDCPAWEPQRRARRRQGGDTHRAGPSGGREAPTTSRRSWPRRSSPTTPSASPSSSSMGTRQFAEAVRAL